MASLLQKLPATIVLITLAAVFLVTCRKHSSARIRLWVWGWGFVLSHFAIRLLGEVGAIPKFLVLALDTSLLCFAGIAFAVSASPIAEFPACRRKLVLLLGTPAVFLSCAAAYGSNAAWLSILAVCVMYFGTIAFFATRGWRHSVSVLGLYAVVTASGIWSIFRMLHGNVFFPLQLTLCWLFLLSAILFVRAYPRLTSGVVTTTMGFGGWAAVWAITMFMPGLVRALGQFNEFWNVPKYILAFGMILVLLEDERYSAEAARQREIALNTQLESFAEVTSRLLGGESVNTLCGKIASIITQVTTFSRIVILLADEQQEMYVAGSSGVDDAALTKIVKTTRRIHPKQLAALEQDARFVGRTSFVCSRQQTEALGTVPGTTTYSENPYWHTRDELLVPIRSPRGMYAGFFILDEPRDVLRVTASEMSKLELLANDLGVAVERAYLQREIVRNEKLAGIGQLVAGMAHELNNPLTAVLGHSEILSETGPDEQVRQQASVIQRESLRMKRIIESLVRFARQDRCENKLLSVNTTLQEILKLWGYQAKSRGVKLQTEIDNDLPMVRFDEAQLKHVFLNILGNAFDAVDAKTEKLVTIQAKLHESAVNIMVCDSGVGFQDPDRVFDPFFSTKGVGKGSGLGLSVCYGIVKQHGGNIHAHNLDPHGACITIELPVAQAELALVSGS